MTALQTEWPSRRPIFLPTQPGVHRTGEPLDAAHGECPPCNGDCVQGRSCPVTRAMRRLPVNHNHTTARFARTTREAFAHERIAAVERPAPRRRMLDALRELRPTLSSIAVGAGMVAVLLAPTWFGALARFIDGVAR